MNVSLQPPALAISQWLQNATTELQRAGIESARLDAEIVLAHTLRKPRTFLHAHDDELIELHKREIADARLALRIDRTPIAYIIGHKEFFGRPFTVTTATLIPRPESETIIDILKEIFPPELALGQTIQKRLIDVGTGSGCLGITAKLELPSLNVTLVDISEHALSVAKKNAEALHADVTMQRGDLLRGYPLPLDIVVANLPYVSRAWEVSPETNAEPAIALYAESDGLALINQLIPQAEQRLRTNGALLLEADPRQHSAIVSLAKQYGFAHEQTRDYIVHLTKID